jgi:hypothetical protein
MLAQLRSVLVRVRNAPPLRHGRRLQNLAAHHHVDARVPERRKLLQMLQARRAPGGRRLLRDDLTVFAGVQRRDLGVDSHEIALAYDRRTHFVHPSSVAYLAHGHKVSFINQRAPTGTKTKTLTTYNMSKIALRSIFGKMDTAGEQLVLVSNIPRELRSADLRSFFNEWVEGNKFCCFHYLHRSEGTSEQRCCCLVRMGQKDVGQFLSKYHGQRWLRARPVCLCPPSDN